MFGGGCSIFFFSSGGGGGAAGPSGRRWLELRGRRCDRDLERLVVELLGIDRRRRDHRGQRLDELGDHRVIGERDVDLVGLLAELRRDVGIRGDRQRAVEHVAAAACASTSPPPRHDARGSPSSGTSTLGVRIGTCW